MKEIFLIDLSSIAYPIWHMSQSEPDPNATSTKTVARIRALTSGKPHAAVCCDSGRSFRAEIAPSYKGNRPEQDGTLQHQITLAREQLEADGFPVWAVKGFEADDLVASATAWALRGTSDETVLILSADKDLLQLVGDRVRAMSVRDGSIIDAEGVKVKMGVRPEQMRDYLTLVGDTSDNIAGVKGIGPKRAAELLAKFTTLDALYAELEAKGGASIGLPPAMSQELRAFKASGAFQTARALVTLRTDVDLPFAEIDRERVPKDADTFGEFESEDDEIPQPTAEPTSQEGPAGVEAGKGEATDLPGNDAPHHDASSASRLNSPEPTALAIREPDAIIPAPAEWERGLDPRSMKDARILAEDMFKSRMFSAYGTPHGVLSTVMVGRELGLPAMASLRSIHNIEGKHCLAASLMVAIVIKSGLAEYFEPISFSDTEATYETKRKGARNPVRLTHTIEMARQAWPKTKADWEKSFLASGWGRNPTDMLVARSSSRLARMVYPDLLSSLYTPEELAEIREQVA